MLLSMPLFATPVKDTVWWETTGGRVTEQHDQSTLNCSLMLYNDEGSIVFRWDDPGSTSVTAIGWNWEFPYDWQLPVAVQLGDVWLSNGGNSAVIQAVGRGNTVSFAVNQPVDDLLRPADHVEVRTRSGEFSIKLNPAKTDALLSGAQRCRDMIKR